MEQVYKTKVKALGDQVDEFLAGQMIILFKEEAPPELAEMSVLHVPEYDEGKIAVGDVLWISDREFEILAVGDEANKNMKKLGHSTLKFKGEKEAQLPGDINLEEEEIPMIQPGTEIEIVRK